MIKRKRKSPIWDHFDAAERQRAKCKYCPAKISNQQGNTSNMTTHLRTKHIAHYLKMVNEKEKGVSGFGDEEEASVDEENLLTDVEIQSPPPGSPVDPAPSPSGTSTSVTGASGAKSAFFSPPPSPSTSATSRPGVGARPRSATPGTPQQGTLDGFRCDSKTTERLHYAVTHYIVTCNRPLNTVEKSGFKEMLQASKPGYKVLSRRTLTDKFIPRLLEQVKSQLKMLLKDSGEYSLTSDNWTSTAGVPYTSLTAHFFDEGWENLYAVTLSCRASHVSHTGVNLKDFFEEELQSWNASVDKCVALTTDNASDMRLAAELMHLTHMRCIAHTLQNGVQDILKSDPIKGSVKASKELLAWLSTSKAWAAYAAWAKKTHGEEAKKLPSISPTRWWTELKLFEQIVESHDFIRQFAAAYERGKHLRNIPGSATMYVLRSVIKALKPMEQICTNLSGDTYVTASAVLPILHLVEVGFEDDDVEVQDASLDEDDLFGVDTEGLKPASLRAPIVLKLHKRYSPGELDDEALDLMTPQMAAQTRIDHKCAVKCNDLLVKVSFLDPRYKEELNATERERAVEQLKSEFEACLPSVDPDLVTEHQTAPNKLSLAGLFAKRRKTAGINNIQRASASSSSSSSSTEVPSHRSWPATRPYRPSTWTSISVCGGKSELMPIHASPL